MYICRSLATGRGAVGLWIALIAAKLILIAIASAAGASAGDGTSSLLLTLGVSLLAEAAIAGPRARSTGLPFATGRRDSQRTSRPGNQDWSQEVPSPGPAGDDDYYDHHHDHHGLTGPS